MGSLTFCIIFLFICTKRERGKEDSVELVRLRGEGTTKKCMEAKAILVGFLEIEWEIEEQMIKGSYVVRCVILVFWLSTHNSHTLSKFLYGLIDFFFNIDFYNLADKLCVLYGIERAW